MEAVLHACFDYSTDESQKSNSFNNSLFPGYHTALVKSANMNEYEVMKTTRMSSLTNLKNWPKETRKVEYFTPTGKKCLERLQLQIAKRPPKPAAMQCMSMLIDCTTKKYAK